MNKNRLIIRDYRSVEGIFTGMAIDKALKQTERKFTLKVTQNDYVEGNHKLYEVYRKNDPQQLLFTFNAGFDKNNLDKVYRILIYDNKYRTPEGISAGMSLSFLRQNARLKAADFNYSDGLFISSSSFDGGYWMDLKGIDTDGLELHPPVLQNLPGNIRIKAIALF